MPDTINVEIDEISSPVLVEIEESPLSVQIDITEAENGEKVELRNNASYIQWKYESEETWNNLVSLSDITGPQGESGEEIEIRNNGTYIQWKYTNDISWTNLIEIADLIGPKGDTGEPGTTTWGGITDKPSTFPPSFHEHSEYVTLIGDQNITGTKTFGTLHKLIVTDEFVYVADENDNWIFNSEEQVLSDTNGVSSVQWANRNLSSSDGSTSIYWENRQLVSPSGDPVFQWLNGLCKVDGVDFLVDGGNISTSGTVTGTNLIYTSGGQTIQSSDAKTKTLILKGALSQTANIFEVQNSAGTNIASISPSGYLTLTGSVSISSTSDSYIRLTTSGDGKEAFVELFNGITHMQGRNTPIYLTTSNSYSSPNVHLATNGHVGIGTGTAAPVLRLHVSGSAGSPATSGTTQSGISRWEVSTGEVLDYGAMSGAPWSSWFQATNKTNLAVYYPLSLNPRGGNVGIGTLDPLAKLDVVGDGSTTGGLIRTAQTASNTTNKYGGIRVPAYNTTQPDIIAFWASNQLAQNEVVFGGGMGGMQAATRISFYTASSVNGGLGSERLYINSVGQVVAVGNIVANATNNTMPNQTVSGDSSVLTFGLSKNTNPFAYSNMVSPSATVGYLPLGFPRLDANISLTWGTDNVPAVMLPFLCTKSFQKISINHTTGTHATAVIEIAIYNVGADGKPTTLIEQGTVPLNTTGVKTLTLSQARAINGLFLIAMRPSVGTVNWAATGGSGTLAVRGINIGQSPVISQLYGAVNPATMNLYEGMLMYSYASYTHPFPADLSSGTGVSISNYASGGVWACCIHN